VASFFAVASQVVRKLDLARARHKAQAQEGPSGVKASFRSRFDFAFIPSGSIQDTIGLVRLGEELGYRCAWLPDQTFHRDPFVLLGLCAQATTKIGLGLGITSPFTRLPVQIARAAGVIDELAGGRFRLGLGTANAATVLKPLGIELRRAAGRLRDSIVIIRRLLAGESVSFEGPDDIVRGVKLDFRPFRSALPIYLGTRGARTIELVGELADGVLVESLFHGGGMTYVFNHLEEGLKKSHRSRESIDVVAWQLVQITDDPISAINSQKAWIARSIKVGPVGPLRRIGIPEDVIVSVIEAMDRGDVQRATSRVTDEAVKCLTIIGDAAHVSSRVDEIFAGGATTVALLLLGPMNTLKHTLQEFAHKVMPAFQTV